MSDLKLVFFDVDGTLLNTQGRYSESLKSKLIGLKAAGVKLAVASGRPPFACQFLFDQLEIDDTGLFFTGGMIYQPSSREVIKSSVLAPQLALNIYRRAMQLGVYCELYQDQGFVVERPHFITKEHSQQLRCKPNYAAIAPLITAPGRRNYKLLLGEDSDKTQQLERLEQEFSLCRFAYAALPSYPSWRFASVVPAAADKHIAFQQLLAHHQLSADQVMAIGDSQSDQVFIELAGVGVAMGNAIAALKQKADLVTASADEDGAYKALCEVFG